MPTPRSNPFDDQPLDQTQQMASVALLANPFEDDEPPTSPQESVTLPTVPPAAPLPALAAEPSNPFAAAETSTPAMPDMDAIEVQAPSFATDMAHGCAGLLSSGRHADISFELPARTLRAHRCILEARCGAPLVQALESGAIGTIVAEAGMLRITLPTQLVGDPSGSSLASLLNYVYTERFDAEVRRSSSYNV